MPEKTKKVLYIDEMRYAKYFKQYVEDASYFPEEFPGIEQCEIELAESFVEQEKRIASGEFNIVAVNPYPLSIDLDPDRNLTKLLSIVPENTELVAVSSYLLSDILKAGEDKRFARFVRKGFGVNYEQHEDIRVILGLKKGAPAP